MKELILMLREMRDKSCCAVTHAELASFLTMFLHCVADIKDITQAIDELEEETKIAKVSFDFPLSNISTQFPQG